MKQNLACYARSAPFLTRHCRPRCGGYSILQHTLKGYGNRFTVDYSKIQYPFEYADAGSCYATTFARISFCNDFVGGEKEEELRSFFSTFRNYRWDLSKFANLEFGCEFIPLNSDFGI